MNLTLFLPWFPILLAVGVGGRLLGRQRGFALGALCALFWVTLVQAERGAAIWREPWQVLSLLAGIAAMIAMGGWAGEASPEETRRPAGADNGGFDVGTAGGFGTTCRLFDEWLRDHRHDADPWPAFGEFIRMMLHQTCGARHVRIFRVTADGKSIEPLHITPSPVAVEAEEIIRGLTGGETRFAGARSDGGKQPVSRPGHESAEGKPWRFSIQHGEQPLGIVQVGHVDAGLVNAQGISDNVVQLVNLFWALLASQVRNRTADTVDPVSGLPSRQTFLRVAAESLRTAHEQDEPVAVAVIALERLRELNDAGRWEAADEVVRETANVLRLKARAEDCLGRFDGSRFVVLLRRVDARLASLIVAQVMARLNTLCGDAARWQANITVRCGIVGSGAEAPDLRTLVSGALRECHRARDDQRSIASGLEIIRSAAEAGAPA